MKKGLVLLVLVALTVSIGAVACSGGGTAELPYLPSDFTWYHNDDFDYSVGYPSGWEVWEETTLGAVQIGDLISGTNLNAGVEYLLPGDTLEDYLAYAEEQIDWLNGVIHSEEPIVVNGRDAYELDVTIAIGELEARELMAIMIEGDMGYFVICAADTEDFYDYWVDFDTIINSFTIR